MLYFIFIILDFIHSLLEIIGCKYYQTSMVICEILDEERIKFGISCDGIGVAGIIVSGTILIFILRGKSTSALEDFFFNSVLSHDFLGLIGSYGPNM